MGYLSPGYNVVVFGLEPSYTAPAFDAVNFEVEPPGGSMMNIPVTLEFSSTVSSFSDFRQEIETGFFLNLEITGRSGPTIAPDITLAFSSVVETYKESNVDIASLLAFYSDVTIGIKSFSDPVVGFALGVVVDAVSGKRITTTPTFAFHSEVEISEIGEPLFVRSTFGLSINVSATTPKNNISATFALSIFGEQSAANKTEIRSGFAFKMGVDTVITSFPAEISATFGVFTTVTAKQDSACVIPSHDDSRWT